MQYDVFISYSRKDMAVADQIAKAFDAAGISYFIGRQEMDGGLESSKVLATAIKESTVFLFLASKNSYESKYTRNEVAYVFNKKEDPQIIPYIIDGSTLPDELELTLSSFKCRDMRQHPVETVVGDVLEKLGRTSDARYRPTPAPKPSAPVSKSVFQWRRMWPWLAAVLAIALVVILAMRGCGGKKSAEEAAPATEEAEKPEVEVPVVAPTPTPVQPAAPTAPVKPVPAGYVDLGLSVYWKNSNEWNSADDYGFYTYDDAVANFGSRLPTREQLSELNNRCTWTWSDSKKGYYVKGPNGNSIFLPAAGFRGCNDGVILVGNYGFYWSSTPYGTEYAWYLGFYSGGHDAYSGLRCNGFSVRLVQGK